MMQKKYTEALAVKPAEQYPKTKITEIDAALDANGDLSGLETTRFDAVIRAT